MAAQNGADFTSAFFAAGFDRSAPAFAWLAVDSLGRGNVSLSPVIPAAAANAPMALKRVKEGRFRYVINAPGKNSTPAWEIELSKTQMTLRSRYIEGAQPQPWTLAIDQQKNHATLLGLLNHDGSIQLPAILHLPDHGTFRIASAPKNTGALGYEAAQDKVKINFPAATRGVCDRTVT